MTTCAVEHCDRPVGDAWVCSHCAGLEDCDDHGCGLPHLARDLGDIAALIDELWLVIGRQSRYAEPNGSATGDARLLTNRYLGTLIGSLRNELVTDIRALETNPDRWPEDDLSAMARWLLARVEPIRHHIDAGLMVVGIGSIVECVRRDIDRPADRWYAGRCKCAEDLYAKSGAAMVVCRKCGSSYDVAQRRKDLLAAAHDVLATPTEISRAVMTLSGQHMTRDMINGYVRRKRLIAHGLDTEGRALYRVGDVVELAREQAPTRRASVA